LSTPFGFNRSARTPNKAPCQTHGDAAWSMAVGPPSIPSDSQAHTG
jgi:hypothetical protein